MCWPPPQQSNACLVFRSASGSSNARVNKRDNHGFAYRIWTKWDQRLHIYIFLRSPNCAGEDQCGLVALDLGTHGRASPKDVACYHASHAPRLETTTEPPDMLWQRQAPPLRLRNAYSRKGAVGKAKKAKGEPREPRGPPTRLVRGCESLIYIARLNHIDLPLLIDPTLTDKDQVNNASGNNQP